MSQERVSGFPEKGADLRGSPGTSGEVWGTTRQGWESSGNLWIAVKFHSERTSGEVAENFWGSSGNFRGSPGTSQKLGGARLPTSDSPNLSPNQSGSEDMDGRLGLHLGGRESSTCSAYGIANGGR